MYLGYRHSQFLDFRYDLDENYKFDLDRLADVHSSSYLFVNMVSGTKVTKIFIFSIYQILKIRVLKKLGTF